MRSTRSRARSGAAPGRRLRRRGGIAAVAVVALALLAACELPTALEVDEVTSSSVTISWEVPERFAANPTFTYGRFVDGEHARDVVASAGQATVDGLAPATTYELALQWLFKGEWTTNGPSVTAQTAPAGPPEFGSGHGITVTGATLLAGSERTYVVDVATPAIDPGAVNGTHQVRVTLPTEYLEQPNWRFPVLYLLHGGAGGSSRQWTSEGGAVEPITEPHRLITVMPDGGKVGWYTNWVDTSAGAQAWETFHLAQLVPWIDANLRTVADRSGRAVAGLSMGGFGAVHYAQQRPDLFSYAASFSGALDLGDIGVRAVISQQAAANGYPVSGPFGTAGTPDSTWDLHNPLGRATDLEDVWVSLYAGSGTWDLDVLERTVGATTGRLSAALAAAGIEHHWWMYGRTPQPTVPYRCDGGHNFGCWNFALNHSMPAMMDRLSGP